MPDLGAYASYVAAAYAVSIALLVALVGLSVLQGRRIRRKLAEAEARRADG